MKKIFLAILAFTSIAVFAQTPLVKELNEGWKFKQARLNNWYAATVPGTVHTDLMKNGIIEDPYFRLNERGVQWVDKEDWIYTTEFNAGEFYQKQNIFLDFKGLDTYADVFLNDSLLLKCNNMFREWRADVKRLLKPGSNTLRIIFYSPLKIDEPKWAALPYQLEAGNDQSENGGMFNKKVSVFSRKAGYHYGWDWGPRIVTSGIWRPINLVAWDNARLENVFYRQDKITTDQARVTTVVELEASVNSPAQITVTDENSGKKLVSKLVNLNRGINKIELPFVIKKPALWWSNGLGDPHLYNFKTSVSLENKVADEQTNKIGLRSVKVINKRDAFGKSFYVELNGRPVFAKGANYIPCDMFLPRVTNEKYEKTILDAVAANMNMLRVWGGGIYENDVFYELCDKYGIMIWQDFMFACSLYPAEGELLENMRLEAIDNVRRLRNHASIALWCGNNENNDAWFTWGWKQNYEKQNPAYAKTIWNQYVEQFHKMLPKVVVENDPTSFYWPSSPFSEFGQPSNDHSGDRHFWSVWHAKEPIAKYNEAKSRFFSEYGFQSFPEFESVKLYAPQPKDWDIYSEVMMSHQRGGAHANGLIESYLLNEYRKPKSFEMFLYMNQVLQGDAIKTAMEAHRRAMPYTMGSLYWQHNDVWPVASWSARDYYGRWKAQQYFARSAYADILVSPITEGENLRVYVVNDRLKNAAGTLHVKLMKLDGTVVYEFNKKLVAKANSSNRLFSESVEKLIAGQNKNDLVAVAKFETSGKTYTNHYFLLKQKDINFPIVKIGRNIQSIQNGYEITLTADKFARAVFLSIDGINNFFENNYFDLLPNEPVKIKVNSNLNRADFEKQLKIVSLVDGY